MPLEKRSVSIAGHSTSVALEPEFWAVLDNETAKGQSLASLIRKIDEDRDPQQGLASAIRIWALARAGQS